MIDNKIACVIVTYNRKKLLKNCLDAIVLQTYKPHTVYIVDNASTDGTMESVKDWGYYECENKGIQYKYILNPKNEGGAGGFYLGMKIAYNTGLFDAIWLMDDDGTPEKECLKKLVPYLNRYNYIAPLVLSPFNDNLLSFAYKSSISNKLELIEKRAKNGIIESYACPFNGVLYSTNLIAVVGFPNRKMFIWGDENNYDMRCKKNGFNSITVIDAIHRHPVNRQEYDVFWGKKVIVIDTHTLWKAYCYYRNAAYNLYNLYSKWKCFRRYVMMLLYYIFIKKDLEFVRYLTVAWIDGVRGDFEKLEKYKH